MHIDLLKTLKILIVEDEQRLSKLLKEAISEYFFSVIIAKDGLEGFKKFKENKPDIIITDIMMPNCDGLQMTSHIRKVNEDIPIIVLSAYPDELLECINKIAINLNKKRKILLKDGFIFDNNSTSLYKNNNLINLTKREKEFFYLLLKHSNKVVSSEEIKTNLWSESVSDERLRTFIKRLRIKTSKQLIENSSGQGYLISPNYSK